MPVVWGHYKKEKSEYLNLICFIQWEWAKMFMKGKSLELQVEYAAFGIRLQK